MEKKWLRILISIFSGAIIGGSLAILGPILWAVILWEDPIHSGPYVEVGQILLYTLPWVFGIAFGFMAWKGKFRKIVKTTWILAGFSVIFLGFFMWFWF